MREIEKILKRFNASLEWLMERIGTRGEEMDAIRRNGEIGEQEKVQTLGVKRMRSIEEVLEEVEVLIDAHFFNEFWETKSSLFLKRVIANQNVIETSLLKRTWRTLNCTPKTLKVIREVQENLLCVGKRRELVTKTKTDSKC